MKNAAKSHRTGRSIGKGEGATWARSFAQLMAKAGPHLGPGVGEDIERDLSGPGSAAVGRRIGTAFLSQPFAKTATVLRSDHRAAEAMAETLATVRRSAKAHRDVADLLDMAEARAVIALRQVMRDLAAVPPWVEDQRRECPAFARDLPA